MTYDLLELNEVPTHFARLQLGLGWATYFMVQVGFQACSFGMGWARVTVNLDRLILGHFWATIGPHLGHY